MPSDDYTSISRGPLKLKGAAGVTKKKKKKASSASSSKDKPTDLAKNLSTGSGGDTSEGALVPTDTPREGEDADDDHTQSRRRSEPRRRARDNDNKEGGGSEEDESKTETERRFAEAKRKRVCSMLQRTTHTHFFFLSFVPNAGRAG